MNLFREWNKELEKSLERCKKGQAYTPSLSKAIVRGFWFKFSLLGLITLFEECGIRYENN